jgi:hypothetical protein
MMARFIVQVFHGELQTKDGLPHNPFSEPATAETPEEAAAYGLEFCRAFHKIEPAWADVYAASDDLRPTGDRLLQLAAAPKKPAKAD